MTELRELYQEVIIDHGRRPRNFGALQNATYHKEGFNPLCGDKLTLFINAHDDLIQKIQFEGSGCAISTASASLMTETLQGKSKKEFVEIFDLFHRLVTEGILADELIIKLGKLAVLGGVAEFPARVKCATLAWHTMKAALQQEEGVVCTENDVIPPIITLTYAAVTHIKNLMQQEKDAIGFRLSLKKTGCSGYAYVPEIAKNIRAEDFHFIAQDHLPVYVDPAHQEFIKGLLIDYVEEIKAGLKQKRLVFINPNEKNRCGCGESFTIEKMNHDV